MNRLAPGKEDMACVVAIDVDARQRYIFETDKLREMLGASRIIDNTRTRAESVFAEGAGLFLFSPVSGEIRAWCRRRERDVLLSKAWEMREWLNSLGVSHTIAYWEGSAASFEPSQGAAAGAAPDLASVHQDVGRRARLLKDGKPGADATPRCSLFAACQIHGSDAATEWNPGGDFDGETRRELVGYRAKAKLATWTKEKNEFYDDHLTAPIWSRFREMPELLRQAGIELRDDLALRVAELANNQGDTLFERPITFSDLAEREKLVSRDDQFIAFLCADGDGMGRVISRLRWNAPDWGDEIAPWRRNRHFSESLDRCIRNAMIEAVVDVTLPVSGSVADVLQGLLDAGKVELPILPLLRGGEDIWMVAMRECALPLATTFARSYQRILEEDSAGEVIRRAKAVAGCSDEVLSLSVGIVFARAGHPVSAMIEGADQRLLRSAKALRKGGLASTHRPAQSEGCIDWHWIESSLAEDLTQARARLRYKADDKVMHLTTRPWTLSESDQFVAAAQLLAYLPRRKREQIETIVRLGYSLSLLAWESWWKGLPKKQQGLFERANSALPATLRLCDPSKSPWRNLGSTDSPYWVTPLVDLLALQHVLGLEGRPLAPASGKSIEGQNATD